MSPGFFGGSMASTGRKAFLDQNVTADTTGEVQTLGQGDARFIAFWKITNYVSGTFNCDIEHSPDGETWFVVDSFAALGAAGSEALDIATESLFPRVRANVSTAAAPDATVRVDLYYDKHR
jgi:hypothetical protein